MAFASAALAQRTARSLPFVLLMCRIYGHAQLPAPRRRASASGVAWSDPAKLSWTLQAKPEPAGDQSTRPPLGGSAAPRSRRQPRRDLAHRQNPQNTSAPPKVPAGLLVRLAAVAPGAPGVGHDGLRGLEVSSVGQGLVGDGVGPDPATDLVPAHPGLAAGGGIVNIQEDLVFALDTPPRSTIP